MFTAALQRMDLQDCGIEMFWKGPHVISGSLYHNFNILSFLLHHCLVMSRILILIYPGFFFFFAYFEFGFG